MGSSELIAGTRPPADGAPQHEQSRSHAWLERDGVIVDITADQFDEGLPPVLVVEVSVWHDAFADGRTARHVGSLEVERTPRRSSPTAVLRQGPQPPPQPSLNAAAGSEPRTRELLRQGPGTCAAQAADCPAWTRHSLFTPQPAVAASARNITLVGRPLTGLRPPTPDPHAESSTGTPGRSAVISTALTGRFLRTPSRRGRVTKKIPGSRRPSALASFQRSPASTNTRPCTRRPQVGAHRCGSLGPVGLSVIGRL